MKRTGIWLLAVLLVALSLTAIAETSYAPGDTVTFVVKVSSDKAAKALVGISASSAFELVSIENISNMSTAPNSLSGRFVFGSGTSEFKTGSARVTVRIKAGTASGQYSMSFSLVEAYDVNIDEVACSVSGSATITVVAACAHANTEEVIREATCTETGEKQTVCKDCGEVLKTETIPALGHDFGEYEVTTEPTCTEKGEETSKCSRCEEKQTREIAALGHDFGEYEVTTEPTCTEKGEETSKCSRCEEKQTREIAALGHDFGESTVTKEATCTEKGEKTGYCTRCNQPATEEIPALGHDFGEYEVTTEPTCTEKGEETSKCSRCEEKQTREVAALGHDFGEYEVTTEPTCTEKGEETSKCSRCEEKQTREVAALVIVGGEYVQPLTVTHNAGDWLKVKTIHNVDGFIKVADTSRTLPASANGKLVILSPANNMTYDINTTTITVEWASGLALPAVPEVEAFVLDASYNMKLGPVHVSGYDSFTMDISSLDSATGYMLTLNVTDINGDKKPSQSVVFNIDKLTDSQKKEQAYREWYTSAYGPLNALKTYGELYMNYGALQKLEYKKDDDKTYEITGPYNIVGKNTLTATYAYYILHDGYLTDDKDHILPWKSQKVGLDHIILNPEDQMDYQYIVIGNMLRDKELKTASGQGAVENMIAQKSENAIIEQKCQTFFSGLDMALASLNTVSDFVKIGLIAEGQDTKTVDKVMEAINDVVPTAIDISKALVENLLEETDNQILIAKYIDVYKEVITSACDEYVECLEGAYFPEAGGVSNYSGDSGMTYSQAAAYNIIKQFYQYKSKIGGMSSNDEAMKEVLKELMVASGFNGNDVNRFLEEQNGKAVDFETVLFNALPDIFKGTLQAILDKFVDDIIDDVFKELVDEATIRGTILSGECKSVLKDALQVLFKGLLNFNLVKDSNQNLSFSWNVDLKALFENLKAKLKQDTIKELVVSLGFVAFLRIAFNSDFEGKTYNDLTELKGVILKNANNGNLDAWLKAEKVPVAGTIFKAFTNAWKTGSSIGKFISNEQLLNDYEDGLEVLRIYSTLFYNSMKVRYELYLKNELLRNWKTYVNGGIDSLSVAELESLRSALVSMIQAEKECAENMYQMRLAHGKLHTYRFKTYDGKHILDWKEYFSYAGDYLEATLFLNWYSVTVPASLKDYVNSVVGTP